MPLPSFFKNILHYKYPLLLLVCPLIAYAQISGWFYTMKWDMLDGYFPYRYFMGECLAAGTMPWWNPYINLGYPFHANPDSGFWYPVVYLLGWNGYSLRDLHLEVTGHWVLAGLGMYRFLRQQGIEKPIAAALGVAFQCSGFFVSNAQHFTYIIGAAWLPWVLFAFARLLDRRSWRDVAALAFCLSMQITGGYPSIFIITVYVLAGWGLVWAAQHRSLLAAMSAKIALVGVLLGLSLLAYGYSFVEAQTLFTRGEGVTPDRALQGAFPPRALLSLLFPFATLGHGDFFGSDVSMINAYLGMVVLAFAPLGMATAFRGRWFWMGAALLSLLAAFGAATPVRLWLYHYVPLMDMFRFPAVFRLFFMVAILVFAARGWQRWQAGEGRKIALASGFALFFGVLVLMAMAWGKGGQFDLVRFWNYTAVESYVQTHSVADAVLSQALFIIIIIIILIILLLKQKTRWLPFLVVADMVLAVQWNINGTMIAPRPHGEFQAALDAAPQGFPSPGYEHRINRHQRSEAFSPSWYNHNIYLKSITDGGYNPFQLRAFERFESSPDAVATIDHPVFYLKRHPETAVRIESFSPNRWEVSLTLQEPDTLCVLQVYYPRWRASVGEVHEGANGLMRVAVAPDTQRLVLEYDAGAIGWLWWLQWLVQLGCGLWAVLRGAGQEG